MRNFSLVMAGLALALSIVTAAVTFAHGQPAGIFQVVVTNNKTGKTMPWVRKTWPDQNRCDAALGNLSAQLRAVADPNPDVRVPDSVGVDDQLDEAVMALVFSIFSNTGRLPNLSISCELKADPA